MPTAGSHKGEQREQPHQYRLTVGQVVLKGNSEVITRHNTNSNRKLISTE